VDGTSITSTFAAQLRTVDLALSHAVDPDFVVERRLAPPLRGAAASAHAVRTAWSAALPLARSGSARTAGVSADSLALIERGLRALDPIALGDPRTLHHRSVLEAAREAQGLFRAAG
jgi:hypothetical protein